MWTCVNVTLDILDLHAAKRRANLLDIVQVLVNICCETTSKLHLF